MGFLTGFAAAADVARPFGQVAGELRQVGRAGVDDAHGDAGAGSCLLRARQVHGGADPRGERRRRGGGRGSGPANGEYHGQRENRRENQCERRRAGESGPVVEDHGSHPNSFW